MCVGEDSAELTDSSSPRQFCLPAIVRSFCAQLKRSGWFMCVVTTTSVWVAVAPMCFFILCDRLRPEGTDSFWVFFVETFTKCWTTTQAVVVSFVRLFAGVINLHGLSHTKNSRTDYFPSLGITSRTPTIPRGDKHRFQMQSDIFSPFIPPCLRSTFLRSMWYCWCCFSFFLPEKWIVALSRWGVQGSGLSPSCCLSYLVQRSWPGLLQSQAYASPTPSIKIGIEGGP